jgi:hypothetical protein
MSYILDACALIAYLNEEKKGFEEVEELLIKEIDEFKRWVSAIKNDKSRLFASQTPPAKPGACFYEPLKAVDLGTA